MLGDKIRLVLRVYKQLQEEKHAEVLDYNVVNEGLEELKQLQEKADNYDKLNQEYQETLKELNGCNSAGLETMKLYLENKEYAELGKAFEYALECAMYCFDLYNVDDDQQVIHMDVEGGSIDLIEWYRKEVQNG